MIDKNKAYRFRGDSERWVYDVLYHAAKCHTTGYAIAWKIASHLLSRGILLEYPELPGEDWEFCESVDQEKYLTSNNTWADAHLGGEKKEGLYCRKKKPVITEVECVVETYLSVGDRIDRIDLPEGFAGPGDRVKVTKL